ncbi:MAG TPA: hypothetical protein VGA56_03815 [Opitutaceae bacterium]
MIAMPNKKNSRSNAAVAEPTEAVLHDVKALVHDSGRVFAKVGESAGEKYQDLRGRMEGTLRKSRDGYRRFQSSALDQLERGTDLVRANPYASLGVAAAVGAVIGILLWPRPRRR